MRRATPTSTRAVARALDWLRHNVEHLQLLHRPCDPDLEVRVVKALCELLFWEVHVVQDPDPALRASLVYLLE